MVSAAAVKSETVASAGPLSDVVTPFFDGAHAEYEQLEAEVNAAGFSPDSLSAKYPNVLDTCHRHARELLELLDAHGGHPVWPEAARCLSAHSLHKRALLQSAFIKQAFTKPFGYAGDKDLMEIIYDNKDIGRSPFAVLLNRVFQELPAAEAVRERARFLAKLIQDLPAGSRVMSLACGPAREVREFIAASGRSDVHFDLLDHDIDAVQFTNRKIKSRHVRHVVANAYDIIKGKTDFHGYSHNGRRMTVAGVDIKNANYDLIYSAGLYDYVRHYPLNPQRGVTGLTSALFSLLRPGGRLVVGNFLKHGEWNPHLPSHRLMMEAYSDWSLIYREPGEIAAFAATCPGSNIGDVTLTDAAMNPSKLDGAVGYLHVTKRSR